MEKKTDEQTKLVFKMHKIVQKAVDLGIGLVGTIILIPLTGLIKAAYMISGDFNNIFFKQKRVGLDGKTIYILKFRTMVPNSDQILEELMNSDEKIREEYTMYKKLENDPRVTKVGKLLRNTSLDEFPQFINLLIGNMSFIGPRPYLHREIPDMGKEFNNLTKMKPGITGYWQVNGRSRTTFDERIAMDLYYIDHATLLMDIKILIKTVKKVFLKEGAK